MSEHRIYSDHSWARSDLYFLVTVTTYGSGR